MGIVESRGTIMPARFSHCLEHPYNQGHFEQGRFVPDCKMCGKCCQGFWLQVSEPDYAEFDLLHKGTVLVGNVIWVLAPCKMVKPDGSCSIHEEKRPACCRRFGYGNYYHPPGCAFFGGETDRELSPHIPQEIGA